MKIKINRNHLWTKIFFDQLTILGVKYACISPGSRSTPLTFTIAKNKKLKSFVHFDERSSAFFALGLAKASGTPVIMVTTSGTAVAELYPAIVEAYQQRVPLIICTADRPPELIGTGANQTINQHNIFKNHIRWFRDLGMPSVSEIGFHHLQRIAIKAFQISLYEDRGPVHLNFPFRKPLEPFSITDEVSSKIIKIKPQRTPKNKSSNSENSSFVNKNITRLAAESIKYEKGIIISGPLDYDKELIKQIINLSDIIKYPIFADGLSQVRFGSSAKHNSIISNYNSIIRSENFINEHKPEFIIQFGRTPTSSVLEEFLENSYADRFLINSFGDKFDPSQNARAVLSIESKFFCEQLTKHLQAKKFARRKTNWIKDFTKAESICESLKSEILGKSKFPNEPSVINEVIDYSPDNGNIFIGNSLPVRDLDNFGKKSSKKIIIHFNRGASGIDGITSTALGIASVKRKTTLITGDLSFLHDLSALTIANKFVIPITIVVINNNGGGIFESLPISNSFEKLRDYFVTPHNLNIASIVRSFGVDYQLINSKEKLHLAVGKVGNKNLSTVLEVQTTAPKSVELRKKYFNNIVKKLNREFLNDNSI